MTCARKVDHLRDQTHSEFTANFIRENMLRVTKLIQSIILMQDFSTIEFTPKEAIANQNAH